MSSNSQSDSSVPRSSPSQTESNKDITKVFEKEKSLEKVCSESDISSDKTEVETSSPQGDEVKVSECNVLEINLDFDKGVTVKMETEIVAKLLTRMGINKDADVEGIQTCPSNLKKIYFW